MEYFLNGRNLNYSGNETKVKIKQNDKETMGQLIENVNNPIYTLLKERKNNAIFQKLFS